MDLINEIKKKGISLMDISDADIEDFILVEKQTHYKYVAEYKHFFGEWNEDILRSAFICKREMAFFKKIVCKDETVGFWGYDRKKDKIDNVFIRIAISAQNNGIGTLFLSYLKEIASEYNLPIYLVVIKTNPAQNLYKRLGFECYKEQDVFYYFRFVCDKYSMDL